MKQHLVSVFFLCLLTLFAVSCASSSDSGLIDGDVDSDNVTDGDAEDGDIDEDQAPVCTSCANDAACGDTSKYFCFNQCCELKNPPCPNGEKDCWAGQHCVLKDNGLLGCVDAVADGDVEDDAEDETDGDTDGDLEEEGEAEEEVDLCADVTCPAPTACEASVTCNPDTGNCDVVLEADGTSCSDGLICNGDETCDDSGVCIAGTDVVCTDNKKCEEPSGSCECLPPYFVQFGDCTGPAMLANMEDLTLADESSWNGSDLSGEFVSGVSHFSNNYNEEYSSWDGFAYSNTTDITTAGFGNQYSAISEGGVFGSNNYAITYCSAFASTPPQITFEDSDTGYGLLGMYVTNATYPYLSMRDGDDYAKKFGGDDGTDPDWFLLTITGIKADGKPADFIEFYLADFRGASEDDYILDDWTWVDLSALGNVTGLQFALTSSDVGDYGMNTPAFFAIDQIYKEQRRTTFENNFLDPESFENGENLTGYFSSGNLLFNNIYNSEFASWEGFAYSNMTDTTTASYANQYSAITGVGHGDTENYAVVYTGGFTSLPEISYVGQGITKEISSIRVTNTTYGYLTMRDGNDFAKQFGGESDDDEDWFLLTVTGYSPLKAPKIVEFYLADYRFADNTQDYIIDAWETIDLSSLGEVTKVDFKLTSSDNGAYGMNTPAYFAIDSILLAE